MKILFDQGTPVPLRLLLGPHEISTAFELGWQQLSNGDLIQEAERAGFEVLITTDKNLKYQQDLSTRNIAILVLPTTNWKKIQLNSVEVLGSVSQLKPGGYVEVKFPA